MLRDEQIDLRRQRAKAEKLTIQNVGKNRVHSRFKVTNPATQGEYEVRVRGFDVGDCSCTCPDYKSNTLGTCKHIEAVLESLKGELPPHLQKKKAVISQAEIHLHYGIQLKLGLRMPPRHSDGLKRFAQNYFDDNGLWSGRGNYADFIHALDTIPEGYNAEPEALDFVDREIERGEMLLREQKWLQELAEGTLDFSLLNVPLYDYQIRGALFLACRGRSILGDDMGLGKTVQTLAAVELLARERNVQRALVVAPSSVKYQWESEIRKFTTRPVQVIEGKADLRDELYAEPTFYRLVNYELVIRDREAINDWKPDVVILDEAQRIKNWETKTSREVKKLKSRYAMVLTGTPLENKLEELYSIVQFVDERRFGPAFQFLHDHRVLDEQGHLKGYRNLDEIREKLAPIFLRRTRGEVLTQLPERTDSTIFVELAEAQRKPYEEQRAAMARLLQKNYLTDLDRKRILACVVHMRTICDSLFLFDSTSRVSPKLDELTVLLPELLGDAEHKAVVFSQWETMVLETAKVLDSLGIGYATFHGNLSGKERKEVLARFAKDETCRVFLSTDAGGVGLNLQSADTVINLEMPWNPAVLEQRIARVHRMGQKRPVRVVNFVTRNSIEERVLKSLQAKQALFTGLFEEGEDEIAFATSGASRFLGAMRGLLDESLPPPAESSGTEPLNGTWQAANHLIDGLAALLGTAQPVPPALREKLRDLLQKVEQKS